jgi:hypothetical protein
VTDILIVEESHIEHETCTLERFVVEVHGPGTKTGSKGSAILRHDVTVLLLFRGLRRGGPWKDMLEFSAPRGVGWRWEWRWSDRPSSFSMRNECHVHTYLLDAVSRVRVELRTDD